MNRKINGCCWQLGIIKHIFWSKVEIVKKLS
jgi:hypothetical protein